MTTTGTITRTYRAELRAAWLFSACSDHELDALGARMTRVTVDAGRVLTRQGERRPECFVVLSGEAVVGRGGAEVGRIGPGFVVGTLGLIGETPARETITAATDMDVLVLTRRELNGFFAEDLCRSVRHRLDVVAGEQSRLADAMPCDPDLLFAWGL